MTVSRIGALTAVLMQATLTPMNAQLVAELEDMVMEGHAVCTMRVPGRGTGSTPGEAAGYVAL